MADKARKPTSFPQWPGRQGSGRQGAVWYQPQTGKAETGSGQAQRANRWDTHHPPFPNPDTYQLPRPTSPSNMHAHMRTHTHLQRTHSGRFSWVHQARDSVTLVTFHTNFRGAYTKPPVPKACQTPEPPGTTNGTGLQARRAMPTGRPVGPQAWTSRKASTQALSHPHYHSGAKLVFI